ncbi:MAG: FGGY-family carbohydrate kinase [Rectinemataceae bacterium]|jgi:xylulokinase
MSLAYLCFDIGSSALKAAILSEDGRLLSLVRRSLTLSHGEGGAYEADAGGWIDAAMSAGAEAVAAARHGIPRGTRGLEVRALSVSGNGPTLLAADAAGLPLGPALSWLDRRAVGEAEEVSALAGKPIDPTFYLPKALRLWRISSPEFRDKIRWFFSCPEYLVHALCGEALTYLPHPGYEPYIWNEGMIAALGLPHERFPPFAAPGTKAGGLLRSAAESLGLEPDTAVVTGYPDFLAAIIGSASVDIGVACDRAGTSEAINLCADRPFPTRALLSLPHPVDGLWNVSGGISTAGAALEWLANALDAKTTKAIEAKVVGLLAEAGHSPPGARGLIFLPYLAGERAPLWDMARRAAFVGLSLEMGRAEMARAVSESLAYGLKLASNLALGEGMPFTLLRVSGQAASDDFLCGLKADILGVPVEAPEVGDCELIGDAAACALALGESSSLSESARSLVRIRRRYEPKNTDAYSKAYASYEAALDALAPVDHAL